MDKQRMEKAFSKGYIQWSLCIGNTFDTMSYADAVKLAKVKRDLFNDWYFGKKSAPKSVLNLLMAHSFNPSITRRKTFKTDSLHQHLLNSGLNPSEIAARFEWKILLLSNRNPLLSRKMFKRLKSNYKKRLR